MARGKGGELSGKSTFATCLAESEPGVQLLGSMGWDLLHDVPGQSVETRRTLKRRPS